MGYIVHINSLMVIMAFYNTNIKTFRQKGQISLQERFILYIIGIRLKKIEEENKGVVKDENT